MSVVQSIIDRLRAASASPFCIIEGAGDFAAIDGRPTALPAAYVMSLREASRESERVTGPVLQRIEADIAVVIITDNVSDPRGDAASSDLEALKAHVRGRLIGFVPTDATDPVEHVSGELLRASGGTLWHEEVFAAAWYLEEQP